ncbi:MAG: site-specific DNA-methyltransferase [Deltaproteobacteria bacterium]|nr:site-specific DNA-methyltransferase [Deltaproteobacteria bacterium]
MEKMKMQTPDGVEMNVDKVAALFPSCITETRDDDGNVTRAVDFDLLRQELSADVVEGPAERYSLNWPGKRKAIAAANAPINKTLRPCREESVDFDTTENLYIEGDNLDALKLLQETYLGKVKMIYIDPPYNTGSDFIYKDNFAADKEEYDKESGQRDEGGGRLVANLDSNGRYHSDWLSMMYPRLRIAMDLLLDDGMLLVSIDDAEVANLKKVLDEIFGASNHMATLVWDRNRKNDAKFYSVGHEYMLVYAKSIQTLKEQAVILREPKEGIEEARKIYAELRKRYKSDNSKIQEKWRQKFNSISKDSPMKKLGRFSKINDDGPYRDDGNISWPGGGGPKYEVIHPIAKKPCKVPDGGWRYSSEKRFWEEVDAGKVVFGPDETTLPRQCRYLFGSDGQVMRSVNFSYAQTSTVNFSKIMGAGVFDNPKSWDDIKRLIRYHQTSDSIIVDFFAGSCTTAHSVMELNAEDGGSRKFIMVQLSEACDEKSEAFKAGYKTIAEIGKERIRRAGQKIKEENATTAADLDIGFRVLKIDSSNMKDVWYTPDELKQDELDLFADHIKEGRSSEDLLFQIMLDWGSPTLDAKIRTEKVGSKTVFIVNENDIMACFEEGLTEDLVKQMAALKPLRAVFRDDAFDDSLKVNVEQIFKVLSPGTEVKSI